MARVHYTTASMHHPFFVWSCRKKKKLPSFAFILALKFTLVFLALQIKLSFFLLSWLFLLSFFPFKDAPYIIFCFFFWDAWIPVLFLLWGKTKNELCFLVEPRHEQENPMNELLCRNNPLPESHRISMPFRSDNTATQCNNVQYCCACLVARGGFRERPITRQLSFYEFSPQYGCDKGGSRIWVLKSHNIVESWRLRRRTWLFPVVPSPKNRVNKSIFVISLMQYNTIKS